MRTTDCFEVQLSETIYFCDIIDQVSDELLLKELDSRGLVPVSKEFLSGNSDENRRELCKLLELNMQTSKEKVINEIKTKI